jgi:GR25 family glycosyltransferase involved in LPS biosynthesis
MTNKKNQEIQFVVISSDQDRKEVIQKQFKDLEINLDFDIFYSEGVIPDHNLYDFKSIYPLFKEDDKTLCCFLSHVKAMKWYIDNTNHPYLLLLEDDVALQKHNFKNKLLQLIPQFQINQFDYISLGYLPHNISLDFLKNPPIKNNENVYWNLYKIYLHTMWGTQAQLFPRKTVESLLSIYDKPNPIEILKSILNYLNNNQFYYINPPRLQIDGTNGLLKHQAIVFPPLVIELNNFKSLIESKSFHKEIWIDGEIRNLYKLNDYYSYTQENNNFVNKNISFSYCKNLIFNNIIELFCRFGSSDCEYFKSLKDKNYFDKFIK